MSCSCVNCPSCNGSGTVWFAFDGTYLGNNRCDDMDNLEKCDECGGSGIADDYCDECAELWMNELTKETSAMRESFELEFPVPRFVVWNNEILRYVQTKPFSRRAAYAQNDLFRAWQASRAVPIGLPNCSEHRDNESEYRNGVVDGMENMLERTKAALIAQGYKVAE